MFFGTWYSVTEGSVYVIFFNTWDAIGSFFNLFVTVIFVEIRFILERGVFDGRVLIIFERRQTTIIFAVGKPIWWRSTGCSRCFEVVSYEAPVSVNWLILGSFEFRDI